jgi:PKD repeat protein
VAVITELAGPRFTGLVVNVDALSSTLNAGTPITSNYQWNFGDTGGSYNEITGYNAAHVYDTPGTYTISLTVTNSDGGVSTTTQQVTIAAAQRTQIYVDPQTGSDSNNGSENAPLQSLAAAFAKLGNNSEILLHAGQTFYTNESNHVNFTNVLIGSYGTGANPVIMRTLGNGLSTIASFGNTNGLTIENITVNSPYPATTIAAANKIGLGGFFLGGQNICVRNCTFENVDDAINENGNPVGVLIQGNSAPLAIGLRGYMVWGQGSEQVIIGNYAANTTKEHIVRLVGLDMVNVQQNNFTNTDGKGCIEMHEGQYGWIVDNTVDGGDIRVGPLGLWGEAATSQTDWVKIEDNQLTNTFIYVQSGTHHAMIDNNVIIRAGGAQAIAISGVDSQGRTSMDITIENNTAIDTGTNGNFLDLGGYASGIVLKDNLWIAPKLVVGSYGAAPVYVDDSNLGCFTQISGNIWPSPITLGTYANGGINFVGTSMTSSGYLTPAEWNSQSNVGNDEFENVSINSSYQIINEGVSVGAALKVAA